MDLSGVEVTMIPFLWILLALYLTGVFMFFLLYLMDYDPLPMRKVLLYSVVWPYVI